MHPDAATPAITPTTQHLTAPAPMAREGACTDGASTRCLSSTELLGSAREVQISHGDTFYRLRVTSLGKLILTK